MGEQPTADPSTPSLPTIDPVPTLETEPFWEGTAVGALRLPRCDDCDALIWYPRRFCPVCHGSSVSWVTTSGTGVVYSYTVIRKGAGDWAPVAPYVVAYVELAEGPRLLTNLVGVAPGGVHIGMDVRVVFDESPGGFSVPRFAPAT